MESSPYCLRFAPAGGIVGRSHPTGRLTQMFNGNGTMIVREGAGGTRRRIDELGITPAMAALRRKIQWPRWMPACRSDRDGAGLSRPPRSLLSGASRSLSVIDFQVFRIND